MLAVASVSGRLTLGRTGAHRSGPTGNAPLASEKLVNASSVTAPAGSLMTAHRSPAGARRRWIKIGLAATTLKVATATAVALADIA